MFVHFGGHTVWTHKFVQETGGSVECYAKQFQTSGVHSCSAKAGFSHCSAKAGFSPQNHAKHLNCRGRPQDWQNWLTAETSSKTMQCQSSFLYKRQILLFALDWLNINGWFLRMCNFEGCWQGWKRPQRTSDGTKMVIFGSVCFLWWNENVHMPLCLGEF